MKNRNSTPYSYDEALNFGNGFPDRGVKCNKCGVFIPQFANLTQDQKNGWKNILKTQGFDAADEYLISLTGCNHRWAKIWRLHPNGTNTINSKEAGLDLSASCPFCSKPLRSKSAKQCPHCFKNWR